jgi:hypothetical protein
MIFIAYIQMPCVLGVAGALAVLLEHGNRAWRNMHGGLSRYFTAAVRIARANRAPMPWHGMSDVSGLRPKIGPFTHLIVNCSRRS